MVTQLQRERFAFAPEQFADAFGQSVVEEIEPIEARFPDEDSGPLPGYRTSTGITLVDLRGLFPDDDNGHREATARKRVAVYHHDAVSYDGQTIEEDLERLAVIHRYHVGKGWGGTGYHFAIPPVSDVVYILGGLAESRAHVAMEAAAANPELWSDGRGGQWIPNDAGIGIVWLGNFADRRNDGTDEPLGIADDRPTAGARDRYQQLVEWLPTVLDREIVAVPHKGAHPAHTSCPGDWIHRTATDTFSPAERRTNVDQALALLGSIEVRLLASRGQLRRVMLELGSLSEVLAAGLTAVADGYELHEEELERVDEGLGEARRLLGTED